MRNIHPADELAMIRTDLCRLREREDFLNKGFLSMRLPTRGDEAVASVKILKERRFRENKLPQHLLDDPELWETKVTRHVLVDQLKTISGQIPAPFARDLIDDVLERF
jgi:hypothetical protein